MASYLDKTGLTYFWSKIKTYVTNAVKVTGVKGNSENSYRTGNVNLTAENIGAYKTGPTQIHRNANNVSADPQHAEFANSKNTIEYFFAKPIAGIGDWFYAAHLNPDYTITCNYSGQHGTKGNFAISTLFSPSGSSTCLIDTTSIAQTPFVLTIEKKSNGNITATDVVHLELWGHTITGTSCALTDYKVELLTTGSTASTGEYTWQTVYQRSNVSDKLNGLSICLNPTSYSYLYFRGLRFTISGATPGSTSSSAWNYNCIDLSLFRLMDQRPAFTTARALGALDLAGGTVFGPTTFNSNVTVNGTLTGSLNGNASKVNNHTVNSDVPSNAKFTDTQADWNETDSSSLAYIKNKPTIPPGSTVDSAISSTSENAVQNKVIYTALQGKVDTVSGKGLSTEDYTSADKTKLDGIETGAEVNQNAYGTIKITEIIGGQTTTTTYPARSKSDDFTFYQGNNISFTQVGSGSRTIRIDATDTTYSAMSSSDIITGTSETAMIATPKAIHDAIASMINTALANMLEINDGGE